MSEETKLVTIQLRGSHAGYEVVLTQHVPRTEFKQALSALLSELGELSVGPARQVAGADQREERSESEHREADDPYERLARELDTTSEQVRKILGIKGDSVQLYKASQFKIADAVCLICFAYEKALGQPSMPYDVFMRLLEASQIKMKTPTSVMCFNMINDGYFQKRAYNEGRKIVLESKGERKAREVVKELLSGSYRIKGTEGAKAKGRK